MTRKTRQNNNVRLSVGNNINTVPRGSPQQQHHMKLITTPTVSRPDPRTIPLQTLLNENWTSMCITWEAVLYTNSLPSPPLSVISIYCAGASFTWKAKIGLLCMPNAVYPQRNCWFWLVLGIRKLKRYHRGVKLFANWIVWIWHLCYLHINYLQLSQFLLFPWCL